MNLELKPSHNLKLNLQILKQVFLLRVYLTNCYMFENTTTKHLELQIPRYIAKKKAKSVPRVQGPRAKQGPRTKKVTKKTPEGHTKTE